MKIWGWLLVGMACAGVSAAPPPPPNGPETSKVEGKCDLQFNERNGKWFADLNRHPTDARFKEGSFDATLDVYVGGIEADGTDEFLHIQGIRINADVASAEIPLPPFKHVEAVFLGHCIVGKSLSLADDTSHECIRRQMMMSVGGIVERCGRERSTFFPALR
jgi:hypothetical protein